MNHRIYLTGFMGSGKSFTGQRLAELLSIPLIDLDGEIESTAGMTISEIFATEGEKAFRIRERDALRATAETPSAVIATGGGAPCFHAGMDWMNDNGITVFLDPPLAVVLARLEEGRSHRPLLQSPEELEIQVSARLAARRLTYEKARIHLRPTNPNADVARLLHTYLAK